MAVDTKAPGQAPPDLPSLLLDGRICYIGMAVRGRGHKAERSRQRRRRQQQENCGWQCTPSLGLGLVLCVCPLLLLHRSAVGVPADHLAGSCCSPCFLAAGRLG